MVNRIHKKQKRTYYFDMIYKKKQHKGLMKRLTSPILVGEMSRSRHPPYPRPETYTQN